MTQIRNYQTEFVQRTKDMLEMGFPLFEQKDKEVTFLLNCLLGLIVTISENEKRRNIVFKGNIDNDFLALIPDKIGFIDGNHNNPDLTCGDLTQLNMIVSHKNGLLHKSKLWFINKIRNGIAHQNIEGINHDETWVGVRLWNDNKASKDFEIIFKIEELKKFAIALSDQYLETRRNR